VLLGKDLEARVSRLQEFLDGQNYHSFEGYRKIKEIKQALTDSEIPLLKKKSLLEKIVIIEKKVRLGDLKLCQIELISLLFLIGGL
jgi:hypothetical protein